jgi:hypothetical protein
VVNEVLGRGMSEDVRNVPGFVGEFFFSLGGFDKSGKIVAEYVSKIRCIYIQVQKVYVLYLFLGNPVIFLKEFFGGGRGWPWVVGPLPSPPPEYRGRGQRDRGVPRKGLEARRSTKDASSCRMMLLGADCGRS